MFDWIMVPLYYLISAVMVGIHKVFSTFLDPNGGVVWSLSIVGLTLAVRGATFPLFNKQIKSSRNMQLLAPQLKELQKKYSHDRELLQRKTMELYKDTGTNPFSSCLPILIQMPIFIALFQLLSSAARGEKKGLMTEELSKAFGDADLWGIHLSDSFRNANGDLKLQLVAASMVLLMVSTTFYMQKQLMSKNMPPEAMTGQAAQIQKIMLYVLPAGFLFSGYAFQIGLLIYMVVSNLWTLGQQFWLINKNPTPGSEAFARKQERDARKGRTVEVDPRVAAEEAAASIRTEGQEPEGPRVQPQRKTRKERKQGP